MKNSRQNKSRSHILIRYFKALEKTVPEAEIENHWDDLMLKLREEQKRTRYHLRLYATIACTAALLAGIIWVSHISYDNRVTDQYWKSAIAELDLQPLDTSRQVLLITQSQKQIRIDKGAVVAYSKDGKVSVNEKKIEEQPEIIEYNQLIVPKGKYSRLVLADGSSLYVNAGTKIVYPNRFNEKKREIYVDGEVFIDVKPDESRPFIVKTSTFDIRVLGTAFNVNAYKDMSKAEVVLLRGEVAVKDCDNKEIRIQPNELLDLEKGLVVDKRTVNAADYMAWTQGRLPLAGKNIRDILHKLSLYYGVELDYESWLDKYPLHGTIDLSVPLDKVLERITRIVPARYEKTTDGFYLYSKQDVEP